MAWTHLPKPPTGPGWGGPAKGAGSGPAAPFTSDSPRGDARLDNHDPDEQAYRRAQREQARERRRLKEERTALLEDRLYDVAMGTVTDATAVQIQAGRAVHAMWNGMPTQKTELNASIRRSVEELSDDELLALAGSGESPSGTGEEGDGAE